MKRTTEFINESLEKNKKIVDGILGLTIGDAVGVPVEFKSREELDENPVVDMQGFGTHYQPPGTWSDDSSLTFCLAEALLEDFSLKKLPIISFYGEMTRSGHPMDMFLILEFKQADRLTLFRKS